MKTRSRFDAGLRRQLSMNWLCSLLLVFPVFACAASMPEVSYPVDKEAVITIGLPNDYAAIYARQAEQGANCVEPLKPGARLCARYVFGNDFQLLDWLENGHIDGAVAGPITLKLLHLSDRQPFRDHFVVAAYDAFAKHQPLTRHIEVGSTNPDTPQNVARQNFHAFLQALMTASSSPASSVVIDSQLSPAMGVFLLETGSWLKNISATEKQQQQLWQRLLQRIRFSLSQAAEMDAGDFLFHVTEHCPASRADCADMPVTRDYLLLRRQALPEKLFPAFQVVANEESVISSLYQDLVPKYLPASSDQQEVPAALADFVRNNYAPQQVGSQVRRYFRFTIPELMGLLQYKKNDDNAALVLTGGGVKAAYQTRLVDYLYGNHFISNAGFSMPPTGESGRQPLNVKYIIGTSGGALLGLFVSAINKPDDPQLSDSLWKLPGSEDLLNFNNVFPLIDMLRWLGFLASVLVFSLLAIALYKCSWVRQQLGIKETTRSDKPVEDSRNRLLNFSLIWIAFLALTPFPIRYVNGEALGEHIPELQGFFYFAYVLIAIYCDNHTVCDSTPHRHEPNDVGKNRKWRNTRWFLVAALVLIILPLAHIKCGILKNGIINFDATWGWLENTINWKITINGFLFCSGLLLLAWCIQRWFFYHSSQVRQIREDEGDVKWSFLVLMLMPILSSAGIYVLYKLGLVSGFELTGSFWKGLGITSAAATLFIFAYAAMENRRGQNQGFMVTRLRFLLSRHPSRWNLQMNRHTRIFIFFSIAWLWWNMIVGPGMYGNNISQQYIKGIYDRVASEQNGVDIEDTGSGERKLSLMTYYVAPATSLDSKSERYFMFDPSASVDNPQAMTIPYRQQLAIASDPRWVRFPPGQQNRELLTQVAFASGSPFPVFAAHEVDIGGHKEWLIDGGYAHNTPIDAARILGADRLLVIYSSPLETDTAGGNAGSAGKVFGTMVRNLPRLLPYLYERSQVEDILGARELTVAAMAPTGFANGQSWPLLTDFRQSVVQSMFTQAQDDLTKRIGTIQNWGLPAQPETH